MTLRTGRTESSASGYAPEAEEEFDPLTDDFVPKERKYPHFDLRLSDKQRETFSISPADLTKHQFWPLIGYSKVERIRKYDKIIGYYFEDKPRPIKFASHRDASILEYYARNLGAVYEDFLSRSRFNSCVLAYRSGIGSNIDHAHSLFEEIKHRGNCKVIAVDISKFFDRINHEVLLNALKKILSANRLHDSDFHIFKNLTRYSSVSTEDLEKRLKRTGTIAGRVCSAKEFREVVRAPPKIISTNNDDFGIPQGTPVSGLYANISLLEFDRI